MSKTIIVLFLCLANVMPTCAIRLSGYSDKDCMGRIILTLWSKNQINISFQSANTRLFDG